MFQRGLMRPVLLIPIICLAHSVRKRFCKRKSVLSGFVEAFTFQIKDAAFLKLIIESLWRLFLTCPIKFALAFPRSVRESQVLVVK